MRVKARDSESGSGSANANNKDQLLELTIYAKLDEFDVSQDSGTSSPLLNLGLLGDEEISFLSEEVQSSLGESDGRKEEKAEEAERESQEDEDFIANQDPKNFLPLPETVEEASPDLLQNLRQLRLKEEAWAKRKARKEQRKVTFHLHQERTGESATTNKFIRSCCLSSKPEPINSSNLLKGIRGCDNPGESETSSISGESSSGSESELGRRIRNSRRVAQVHSINFSDRIIPKDRVTFTRESPHFLGYSGASIKQMLARMP